MAAIPDRYAAYETTVTLGAVNFTSVRGDVAATLTKVEANINEAALQGVDILVIARREAAGMAYEDTARELTDLVQRVAPA